jgi:DNA replication protein DnaC
MTHIKKTLRKIASDTLKENMETSVNTKNTGPLDDFPRRSELPGDPDCPICNGIGFTRKDFPIGHPEFGSMQPCTCRELKTRKSNQEQLFHFSNLESFQHISFDNFQPEGRVGLKEDEATSLQLALNQSMQFASSLKGWLLLSGGYGCGKTHLATAVANFALQMEVTTLFLTVPDLLDWLRFAYNSPDSTFEERFSEIRNCSLLVLDDLGTENATSWAVEKLFQILNYRYVKELPTVITTNLEQHDVAERIRSRLEDPELVVRIKITAPDYRSPIKQTTNRLQLSSLDLHNKNTFGSFSLRESEGISTTEKQSLKKAFRMSQKYAENPRGWLILMGSYGVGKTHLAAAVGNYNPSDKTMFIVIPDLLDHLRATFSPSSTVSYDRLFDEVRTSKLLILDDLGTQSATPWAREKLYQLLNYRYSAELPTVITTASSLEQIDPRIRSRMMDEHLCQINIILAPTYRSNLTSKRKSPPTRRTSTK